MNKCVKSKTKYIFLLCFLVANNHIPHTSLNLNNEVIALTLFLQVLGSHFKIKDSELDNVEAFAF